MREKAGPQQYGATNAEKSGMSVRQEYRELFEKLEYVLWELYSRNLKAEVKSQIKVDCPAALQAELKAKLEPEIAKDLRREIKEEMRESSESRELKAEIRLMAECRSSALVYFI